MTESLTADEIIQVALEVEETGRVYYEAMGAASLNENIHQLCRRLSAMEKEHYEKFKAMRSRLAGRAERTLSAGEIKFIHGLVANRIMPSLREALAAVHQSSPAHLLDLAIAMENDSVEFYEHVRSMLASRDAETLAEIIKEEQTHIEDLKLARRHPA